MEGDGIYGGCNVARDWGFACSCIVVISAEMSTTTHPVGNRVGYRGTGPADTLKMKQPSARHSSNECIFRKKGKSRSVEKAKVEVLVQTTTVVYDEQQIHGTGRQTAERSR